MDERENLIQAIKHQSPEFIPYYKKEGLKYIDYKGDFPPQQGTDIWGVGWRNLINSLPDMLPVPVDNPVRDMDALLKLEFPDVEELIDSEIENKIMTSNYLTVSRHLNSLFSRCCALFGMENTLIAMIQDTERLAAFMLKLADWEIGIAKKFIKMGIDAGRLSDDYGSQTGLLMSPDIWRKVIKPALAKICKNYKEAGCFFFLHSCGNIMDIIPDLVEIGIDVFNIQTNLNDLVRLKKIYGDKITFHGGVNTQRVLSLGTTEDVRGATLWAIRELGPGGGLILGPDQYSGNVPKENINELIKIAEKYGKYPLEI